MKFGFVGDLHLSSIAPRSRTDDYSETMLAKLREVGGLARERAWECVIFSGDIFHLKRVPLAYLVRVMRVLREIGQTCPLYTVIGNHDIHCANLETADKCPVGILLESGLLRHLREVRFGDMVLRGLDYSPSPQVPAPTSGAVNVLVAHAYYGAEEDGVSPSSTSGWGAWLLGHDHTGYDLGRIGETLVVRPGALSRGTKAVEDREREIRVAEVTILNGRVTAEYLPMTHRRWEEVFSGEQIEREDVTKRLREYVRALTEQSQEQADDILKVLDEVAGSDQEARDLCRGYLADAGVS